MSDKKQSSVEWLIKQLILKTEFENLPNQYVLMSDKDIDSIIEQAKAKFKDQISRAYFMGLIDGGNHNPQDYFKNTYEDDTNI